MSLSSTVSPYHRLYNDAHQTIMKFLNNRDLLVNYAPVSQGHEKRVHQYHKEALTAIEISSRVANDFFAGSHKFLKLKKLTVRGCVFQQLVMPHGASKIDHITFWPADKIDYATYRIDRGRYTITSQQILMFLEKIPNIKGLRISGSEGPALFQPIEGQRLSDKAKNNLSELSELELYNSQICAHGVLEILQNSTSLTSVVLSSIQLSNALFRELLYSRELTHLSLSATRNFGEGEGEGVNYRILAECHSLRSFRPDDSISEEDLIAIIQANSDLRSLHLKHCEEALLTDRVLQVIAEYLPQLTELDTPDWKGITDAGLFPLVHRCKSLRSLSFERFEHFSPAVSKELGNGSKLQELNILLTTLPGEFFDALGGMTDLTSLKLRICKGCSRERLQAIQALVNLELLTLDCVYEVDDELVRRIINHCPKLHTLIIVDCDADLTLESVNFIRSALIEGRTKLRHLEYGSRYGSPETLFQQLSVEFPRLKVENPDPDRDY